MIILTGRVDPAVFIHAQQAGCAAVLIKPCLPQELARVLNQLTTAAAGGAYTYADPHS